MFVVIYILIVVNVGIGSANYLPQSRGSPKSQTIVIENKLTRQLHSLKS